MLLGVGAEQGSRINPILCAGCPGRNVKNPVGGLAGARAADGIEAFPCNGHGAVRSHYGPVKTQVRSRGNRSRGAPDTAREASNGNDCR